MHVHLVEVMGIKINLNRVPGIRNLDASGMTRLSAAQREQAIGRLQAGQRALVVANAYNVHVSTIHRLQQRYINTNSTADSDRSGRPRVTTPRQDRFINRQHLHDRFRTASMTARETIGTGQRPISDDTVRRRLAANNLRCRRPARGPVLTTRHRQARLQWATQHRHWRHQQWRSIVFSDESRYCVSNSDGRVRVWRRRGERYRDACVMERDPWGGQSIMVWGAIGLNQRIGPHLFQNVGAGRGNGITAQRYVDQILRPHIVPFFARHHNHVFQQDNARPHTARVTMDFLRQHNIRTMPWPALSPDLNPIEHLWDEIQRRLNQVVPRPTTRVELEAAFLRVWAQVPMAFVNRLVHSMYRRCMAVLNTQGGHTRY